MFFLEHGLPRRRPRPARPRPLEPDRRRPRHGPLRRRRRRGGRAPRPARRRPRRPLDRRRRGRALRRAATAAGRVAKAVLIGAVPPLMVKTDGQPRRPADRGVRRLPRGARCQPRAVLPRRRRPARSTASTAPGAKVSQGVIDNWWRQGMMGGAKAHYDCIKAFSETDFTEDLKAIDVPTLVMHGDDDQIVPIADSAAAVGQAAQERHAEGLPGLPARHVHDPRRRHQRRPAGVHRRPEVGYAAQACLSSGCWPGWTDQPAARRCPTPRRSRRRPPSGGPCPARGGPARRRRTAASARHRCWSRCARCRRARRSPSRPRPLGRSRAGPLRVPSAPGPGPRRAGGTGRSRGAPRGRRPRRPGST